MKMKIEVSSESDSGDSINAVQLEKTSDEEINHTKQVKGKNPQTEPRIADKSTKQEAGKSSTSSSSESNLTEARIK